MSARKKVDMDKLLHPEAWPTRAFIGRHMIAGCDRDGTVCIAEFGPNIYGSPVLKAFVSMESAELEKFRAFIAEVPL